MRATALLAGAAIACGIGCGDDRLVLTADPQGSPADGESLVEVSAFVTSIGEPADDGTLVSFEASEAVLFAAPELATSPVPGARLEGERIVEATVRNGRARVYMLAPVAAGSVTVNARFRHDDDVSLGAEIVVEFDDPPLVAAGRFEGEGLGAVEPLFAFECGSHNIGALVGDRAAIRVECTLVMRSASGRDLPHTDVRLFSEAGVLSSVPASPEAGPSVGYVVNAVPNELPVDVAPSSREDAVTLEGPGLIPGAAEQNPRDGLVTLLAVVRGHEAFLDLDGDGTWQPGEPFIDEGEPFLDVDDDGKYTQAIDGPHCCDNNGNGQPDGPNGTWDSDVWIGRAAHILWSGSVSEGEGRSGIATMPVVVPAESQAELTITVVDANFNPVAMNGSSDGFSLSPTGPLRFFPPPDFERPGGTGLQILDRYPFYLFDGTSPISGDLLVDDVRVWRATIQDDRQNPCVEGEWAITATISHTPAAGSSSGTATLVNNGVIATGEACP